jgi:dTDP-4-dehydrorhamnose reductase
MKILLTGASGYLGARLYFDLRKDFKVVGTYHNAKLSDEFIKLDTTNQSEVDQVISQQKPDVIIHAAANGSGKWCETNPQKAVLLNEIATKYIVDAANKNNSKIIFISSFAVLDPTDVYGKTKLNSENYVKTTKTDWVILRPRLIFGFSPNSTNDRPFNRLLRNIDQGTPAIYDTSLKFQATYISHISEIIKIVINRNLNRKIIPIVVYEMKTRFDVAQDILKSFHINVAPIDEKSNFPLVQDDLSILKKLNLPIYTYPQIIKIIVEEIRNRDKFHL